jgi:hypothetical protein
MKIEWRRAFPVPSKALCGLCPSSGRVFGDMTKPRKQPGTRSHDCCRPVSPGRPFRAQGYHPTRRPRTAVFGAPHTRETPIHVTISPAGGQRFHARVQDRHLCTSRTPFFAAARVLMNEGAEPETPITMSHEGSCIVSLRSTVGQAARLSVEESERSGPRFVPYRPFRA